jgi:UDP-N-acetylmuramoyl-tripeptide--D-alanyl-D-alanine ligase
LENFEPFPMRMEVVPLKGGEILINDAYNANPSSMELALETLVEAKGKGKAIAVLGDMLELGNFAEEAHQRIGQKVSELSIDFLLAMGEKAPVVIESAIRHGFPKEKTRIVENHSEAISLLRQMIEKGDWILIKGSRGMVMEKIVEGLAGGRA